MLEKRIESYKKHLQMIEEELAKDEIINDTKKLINYINLEPNLSQLINSKSDITAEDVLHKNINTMILLTNLLNKVSDKLDNSEITDVETYINLLSADTHLAVRIDRLQSMIENAKEQQENI
jgi:hypothetical protein